MEEERKEVYAPIPNVLESKAGKEFDSEKLLYIGVGVVAVVALVAFFIYFVFPSQSVNVDQELVKITLNYSIELEDGTVIKAGEEEFPLGFVGKALGLSDKVDEGINELDEGGEVMLTLSASEAFGEYDDSLVREINRTEKIPRRNEVNREILTYVEDFKQEFGDDPVVGQRYKLDGVPWEYLVTSVEDDEVSISQEAEIGQIVPVSDVFFLVIFDVTEETLVSMMTAEDQSFETDNGEVSVVTKAENIEMTLTPVVGQSVTLGDSSKQGRVLSFDSEKIVLDYNSEYAGEDIVLSVKKLA